MVHLHAIGHRRIHAVGQHRLGALLGQPLRHADHPGGGAEVTDGVRRHADAERRHHVIKETVVMIRRKQEHQLRRETFDPLARGSDHRIDLGEHVRCRVDETNQWRVRKALQQSAHRCATHIERADRHSKTG
ncbi:hypothetical protein D3C76_1359820 [compost metagenome]